MWTGLRVARWIFLLTLTAALTLSVPPVEGGMSIISLPCCRTPSSTRVPLPKIRACYEQRPRQDCNHHAFLIITRRDRVFCASPATKWLQEKIKKGELTCPPDVSLG